jgi:hypothetical protein
VAGRRAVAAAIASFAIVPNELLGHGSIFGAPVPNTLGVPEQLTLLTYMFFHGDILRLASNMLFWWVFGDNVEDALGHLNFLIFYLACGIMGGLAQAFMMPTSTLPLIGASGAVAGVIAAFLMLSTGESMGSGVSIYSTASQRRVRAGCMDCNPSRHAAASASKAGRVVGAYRGTARRRRSCRLLAPPGSDAWRPRPGLRIPSFPWQNNSVPRRLTCV